NKFAKRRYYKKHVTDVTVRHLLEHTAGYLAEHLSGMDYESFVKKSIFAPAGVHDIQVAGPTISDRAPREVLYYMSGNNLGFDPYEMLPSERIGPWGGWIASPIQLLLFM
ncbi:hypothetical protein TELCIR_21126, partial [Teladorsagia circumcincta]